jgi:hypothetical protein
MPSDQDHPTRYDFQNGMFLGSTSSSAGLNWNGISQAGAFGNFSSLRYEGMQLGYNFANAPVTLFGGVETLKYNSGIGGPFAPFDSKSGTLPGFRANAGIEFKPTSNLSLSFGVGYVQQSAISTARSIHCPALRRSSQRPPLLTLFSRPQSGPRMPHRESAARLERHGYTAADDVPVFG